MSKIVIIKYNAGNIGSVGNALRRMGLDYVVSDQPDQIRNAKKVIFPGVGEASSTMAHLKSSGLASIIKGLTQPVLGICLGMQLMCSESEEGNTPGLGIFPEKVKRFNIQEKVPHMGWNTIEFFNDPLLAGLPKPAWFYFVHSYYAETGSSTVSASNYAHSFAAYLKKDNFYAVQFHPEKSGSTGVKFLTNFVEL